MPEMDEEGKTNGGKLERSSHEKRKERMLACIESFGINIRKYNGQGPR